MHRAVGLEYAAIHVYGALQMIVAHGAAAERVSGDQVVELEKAPGGVGDKVSLQRPRVIADLVVHAREDLLLAGLFPGNANAAIGFSPGSFVDYGAAGIVLAHDQVEHGVA